MLQGRSTFACGGGNAGSPAPGTSAFQLWGRHQADFWRQRAALRPDSEPSTAPLGRSGRQTATTGTSWTMAVLALYASVGPLLGCCWSPARASFGDRCEVGKQGGTGETTGGAAPEQGPPPSPGSAAQRSQPPPAAKPCHGAAWGWPGDKMAIWRAGEFQARLLSW